MTTNEVYNLVNCSVVITPYHGFHANSLRSGCVTMILESVHYMPGTKTFTNTVGLVNYLLWQHVAREKAADHTIHGNTQVSNLIKYPVRYLFLPTSKLPISVLKRR